MAINGGINLRKLKGAKTLMVNGVAGVWIPHKEANLFTTDTGTFLNLVLINHRDQYGHDYMCVRKATKDEFSKNAKTEILGNFSSGNDNSDPEDKIEEVFNNTNVNNFTPPPSERYIPDDDPF